MKPYYDHAGIQIYLGDCREILPRLPNVDLATITDPPYGIGFAAQPTKWQRLARQSPMPWDDKTADLSVLLGCFGHFPMAIWGGNYFQLPISRGWLSWFKPDAPPSMGNVELAWTNQSANTRQISCSISKTNAERVGHPTQKPLKVIRWTIQQMPHAKTILDPYMGSGTTLRAAKDLGLQAIGIEIHEPYAEIAANRLSQDVLAL